MKKRTWIHVLSCTTALVIGVAGGVSYSNYESQQQQLSRFENYPLYVFGETLISAQRAMKEATSNPNIPPERAYQDNLKIDIGQLWVLWETMQPELIAQGLPSEKVWGIGSGLQIVYNNILPPNGANPASVARAREWISTFYSCLYPNRGNGPVPSGAILLSRLKSKIFIITSKYESYKADASFQVQSIFPEINF